jgi:hypothetical protein
MNLNNALNVKDLHCLDHMAISLKLCVPMFESRRNKTFYFLKSVVGFLPDTGKLYRILLTTVFTLMLEERNYSRLNIYIYA